MKMFYFSDKLSPPVTTDVYVYTSTDGTNKAVVVFTPVTAKNYRDILTEKTPLYDIVVSPYLYFNSFIYHCNNF